MLRAVRVDDATDFMAMWQDESFAQDAGIEASTDLQALADSLARFELLNSSGLGRVGRPLVAVRLPSIT